MVADLDVRVERMVLTRHRRRRTRLMNLLAALLVVGSALAGARWGLVIGTESAVPPLVPAGLTADRTGFVAAEGAVRVDLYIDYLCPECKNTEAAIAPLLQRLESTHGIELVYHPIGFLDGYSAPRGYSSRAAAAAACASDSGAFAAYTAALFAAQPAERGPGLSTSALISLGRDAGITDPAFASCVTSGRYAPWVSYASGVAYSHDVAVTPTVLVRGKQVDLTGSDPAQTLAQAIGAKE